MKPLTILYTFILAASVTVSGCAGKTAATQEQVTELRIMSYNIHHANPPSRPGVIDLDAIARVIREQNPDLVVLSGLMRLLPPSVVAALEPNLINTHPAYLPEFPGAHGVRRAALRRDEDRDRVHRLGGSVKA